LASSKTRSRAEELRALLKRYGYAYHVLDEPDHDIPRLLVVPAVEQRGPQFPARALVDAEQHLARHRAERRDDPRLRPLPRQRLGARGRVREHEVGVVRVHRQRTRDDDRAGQAPRLREHVVDARPVDGEEDGVRPLRGLGRRAGPGACRAREARELALGAGIAEDHVVPGACEQRAELAAHQSRSENSDAHVCLAF